MSNNDISNISRKDKLKFVDLPENTSIKNISNECLDLLYISKLNKCNSQNINAPFDLLLNSIVLINNKIDKLCNTLDIDKESDANNVNKNVCTEIIKKDSNNKLSELKQKTALNFINDLLQTIGQNKINNIKEFTNIKRSDLLLEKCENVLKKHIDILIKIFGKKELLYRSKNIVDHYIITVLRKIVSECGFKLLALQKREKQNDNTYSTQMYYSVSS